ncbi:MAG: hypothetical protein ACRBBR_10090 [Cellvibrionaceae bacterium]
MPDNLIKNKKALNHICSNNNYCDKSYCSNGYHSKSIKKHFGFLLPLALFLILAASGIALILLQQVTKPSVNLTISSLATNSAYAAETAAGLASNQLFLPITDRRQMDNRCENINIPSVLNVDGLDQCRLVVTCECRYENNSACDTSELGNYDSSLGIENSFYRIQSEASCGSGFAQGYRRIELNRRSP